MKITVVATVLNESDSIYSFLEGLLSQSRMPDEIVIVDGGSTDGTIDRIEEMAGKNPIIKLFVEKGCNVARGRNVAIQHAQSDYIAIADAGSRVDSRWLEELILPFELHDDVDVVGGWTEIDASTPFERWVGLLSRPFNTIDLTNYLPSARSLGLKKTCWNAVGGFPEELTMWSEDTVFLQKLKSRNFKIEITTKAIVYWRPRRNLFEFWIQYYEYGKGDGEARIFSQLYFKRFVLFLSIVFLPVGLWFHPVIPAICVAVLIVAFVRIVIPLKNPSLPVWKLFPLFLLVLIMETAQLFGYCVGRLTTIARGL